ncbi:MAG: MlaD family protein [Bacteroidetes bacterium]|uniref:MlaD family protein n=1 Tax=Phnomibacter sp. TaxID=2836217 RepID=UPI002FDDF5DC|nr:MlaD family protein [Bacteroidota bacterium]
MAFKVSNETKVGALTAITITLFILGFNFLKGRNPLKKATYFYAKFESTDGLQASNPVVIKGLNVGNVYEIVPADRDLNAVLITIRLTEDIQVPANSVAHIKSNPLGTPSIEIVKGDAKTYLVPGDTLLSESTPGFFGSIFDKLGPTQAALDKLLTSLDSVASKINKTMTPGTQANIQDVVANLSQATAQLNTTIASVNAMLDAQNGSIAKTANNLEQVSGTLAANKEKINSIVGNLETTSQKLSQLNLQQTLDQLAGTMESLKATLAKLNSQDNSVGSLLNDKKLYNNLNSTVNSLNLLMQDLRLHPKRYVNVSVFGKKDKSEPLMKPMQEDSVTQEQRRN